MIVRFKILKKVRSLTTVGGGHFHPDRAHLLELEPHGYSGHLSLQTHLRVCAAGAAT